MIQRNTYDLISEPADDVLRDLLVWALNFATQLGLVVHSRHVKLTSRAIAFLEEVDPYLRLTREVSEWPGTRLIGGRRGIVSIYRLTPDLIETFVDTADRLYRWVNPALPEDIHILRADGSVLLGTVTQEADAWMELSGDEFDSLVREIPGMAGVLRQQQPVSAFSPEGDGEEAGDGCPSV
jgi:hypothetical protein